MTNTTPVEIRPPPIVRAVIARAMLPAADIIPDRLGAIVLRPHQRVAAARLFELAMRHGGGMLAEPVGLGKTFTTLATAAACGGRVLIVAPASLRTMWRESLERCAIRADFVSHEALSRGVTLDSPDTLIVDESHRVRSPSTRRYETLAHSCRRSRVLLVTATPLQNRRADIAAQLALFLGRRAWRMSEDELVAFIVRGDGSGAPGVPRVEGPVGITLDVEDDCVDALLSLPPPVPAKDETLAVALLTFGLVHQWSSSRAALVAALERRRARGIALASALEAGRAPTRSELASWTHAGDVVQLAFPELMADAVEPPDSDHASLSNALEVHGTALRALLKRLETLPNPDIGRAQALRRIRDAHPGERIIAFCHYAETVDALRRLLARDAGIAVLTARSARVASGRVSRASVLAQFTPTPAGTSPAPVREAERIDLLIATDVLSEGLNLQEASVVVHLDLPWNPARLEQRVGRVARLGSRHTAVTAYAILPPASAERLLRLEQRLREKLALARGTVGLAGQVLPLGINAPQVTDAGAAVRAGATHERLCEWLGACAGTLPPGPAPIACIVDARDAGFLALVRSGDGYRLVADIGAGVGVDARTIERAVQCASGAQRASGVDDLSAAVVRVERWLASRRAAAVVGLDTSAVATDRHAALARIARTLRRAPRHRRAELATLVAAAREALAAAFNEGAERMLEQLVRAEVPDEEWLRAVIGFGDANARPEAAGPSTNAVAADRAEPTLPALAALIVFGPSDRECAAGGRRE